MIVRASFMDDFDGALPFGVCGLEDDLSAALEVEAELGRARVPGPEDQAVEHGQDGDEGEEIAPYAQRSGGWCHGE